MQLRVLRTSATEQNPAVMRLNSELRGLRAELARMESSQGGAPGSAVDLPVGRIPEAAVDYVRARRELKLQETLLEGMVRQYEIAKLDEAKEGPVLQQVDIAQVARLQVAAVARPDRPGEHARSAPARLGLGRCCAATSRRCVRDDPAARVGLARPGSRLELQALSQQCAQRG